MRLPESCEFYQERIGDEDFKKRFGFHMNGIQNDVISAIEICTAPGLLILEAPMGIGKITVTDARRFKETLCHGIGREKAYGQGLLTIVRCHNVK